MKKTLLSMAAMLLLATGANAQVSEFAVKGNVNIEKKSLELNLASKSVKPGMKKAEEEAQYIAYGYQGSETPVGYEGWPSVPDAQAVAAQSVLPEDAVGYTIVGAQFAVVGSLGTSEEGVGPFCYLYDPSGNYVAASGASLTDGDYEVSTLDGNNLNMATNQIAFAEAIPLTADNCGIVRYGLFYVQNTDENSIDSTPFLYGKLTEDFPDSKSNNSPYLVYGTFSSKNGEGWYTNANAQNPYTPCIQLILQAPNGETAILGVDGKIKPVVKEYFSLDGSKLSAPQKGVNIVKMSDGTTKKVLVK